MSVLLGCEKEGITQEEIQTGKKEIVLALSVENAGLTQAINEYNDRSDAYYINCIYPNSYNELYDFQLKIQMEISSGKGPDLIEEGLIGDVEGYIRNGAFVDLKGAGIKYTGCILPIRQWVEEKNEVYYIPYDFSFFAIAYPSGILNENASIKMENIEDMLEGKKDCNLQANMSAIEIINRYGLWDDSSTQYVDWDNLESHLKEEPFIKLLEMAKKYEYREGRENLVLAAPYTIGVFNTFYNLFQESNEDLYFLGYPRENGNGIYLETNNIYLNKNCENQEVALDFLQYIISEECQRTCVEYDIIKSGIYDGDGLVYTRTSNFPINNSVLMDLCKKEEKSQIELLQGNEMIKVDKYKKGQFDQFYYMIEHARVKKQNDFVLQIICEEIDPYLQGDLSAEEVALAIHNCVQLYFEEMK